MGELGRLGDDEIKQTAMRAGGDPERAVKLAAAHYQASANPSLWNRLKSNWALSRYQASIGKGWLRERDRLAAELELERDAGERKRLKFELAAVDQIICDLKIGPRHG